VDQRGSRVRSQHRSKDNKGNRQECGELFHTATSTAYADVLVDGHRETWPIRSKRFRGWLRRRYYETTGSALGGQAISSELDLLEARAQFDAPECSVHTRIAEHDGRIYLDLADEHWRAVEIGPDGWWVNRCRPCAFAARPACWGCQFRSAGGRSKPLKRHRGRHQPSGFGRPQHLSDVSAQRRQTTTKTKSFRLERLRSVSRGPYPLLAISGEQGSAKTVLSKMLKALVDPNAAPVRALPRDERELMIAANNGYLLAFDNLSGLPAWLSDALCRWKLRGAAAIPTMTRCYFKQRGRHF
jgi:hypothetical protein